VTTILTETPALRPPPRLRGAVGHAIRRRPSAAAGAALLALFAVVALLAPWLRPFPVDRPSGAVFGHPSVHHWLGLDDAGVDVVSLLLEGGRVSLFIGVAAMAVSLLIGGAVGVTAGYFGGAVEGLLMSVTDLVLVVPYLPLMIVIAAIWGPSIGHVVLAIGLLQWTWTARLVRAQVKSVRERTWVRRAQAMGAGHGRVLVRHVVPQIAPLLVALAVLSVAYSVFAETALAFVGLGDPTRVSWGSMIHDAFLRTSVSAGAWWVVVPPGVCVALVVVGCHLLGRGVEEGLNPRLAVSYLSPRTFRVLRSREDEQGAEGVTGA
jgi:peptide/nickel transport system permease protein